MVDGHGQISLLWLDLGGRFRGMEKSTHKTQNNNRRKKITCCIEYRILIQRNHGGANNGCYRMNSFMQIRMHMLNDVLSSRIDSLFTVSETVHGSNEYCQFHGVGGFSVGVIGGE